MRGTSNVLTATFERFGPLTLVEPNPGLRQTAYGVLSDLFSIAAGDLWISPDAPLA
jgi:homoserine dehydrogenase